MPSHQSSDRCYFLGSNIIKLSSRDRLKTNTSFSSKWRAVIVDAISSPDSWEVLIFASTVTPVTIKMITHIIHAKEKNMTLVIKLNASTFPPTNRLVTIASMSPRLLRRTVLRESLRLFHHRWKKSRCCPNNQTCLWHRTQVLPLHHITPTARNRNASCLRYHRMSFLQTISQSSSSPMSHPKSHQIRGKKEIVEIKKTQSGRTAEFGRERQPLRLLGQ